MPGLKLADSVAKAVSIDVSQFTGLVDKAIEAYRSDFTYFEMIIRSGFKNRRKSIEADYLKELRHAEVYARKSCVASNIIACYNVSPCGTGQCPFAQGDLKNLHIPDQPGKRQRPARLTYIDVGSTAYSVDPHVQVYQNAEGKITSKLVKFVDGSWRMYKADAVLSMVPSVLYQEMIDTGRLVLAPDSPNGVVRKLDTFVESYDIASAIEPLMKLRKAI